MLEAGPSLRGPPSNKMLRQFRERNSDSLTRIQLSALCDVTKLATSKVKYVVATLFLPCCFLGINCPIRVLKYIVFAGGRGLNILF